MNSTAKEISRLAAEGYCCSQIMVKMGLEAQQVSDAMLISARMQCTVGQLLPPRGVGTYSLVWL